MIKLTLTSEVLKEEIDLRIKELSKNSGRDKVDEDGKDAEWYENLGLRAPKELSDDFNANSEIDELLDDDESFTQVESPLYVKAELIDLIIGGDEKENTNIFLTTNKSFNVKETAEEVHKLILKQNKLNNKST